MKTEFNGELFANIESIDLTQIKLYFQIKQNWEAERIEKAILGYKQYLYITQMQPGISPSFDVDEIWHRHILHTKIC